MDPEIDNAPELTEYYLITDHGDEWHLHCLSCGKGFALLKASHRTGNLLALLNHAKSHEAPAGKGVDCA